MTLQPGTRIGAYEVTGSLGAGGMGEVYRARDTRLERDVAIKVLPAAVRSRSGAARAASSVRRGCWRRSTIRTSRAIYGFEESGGMRALVARAGRGPDPR